MLDGEEIFNLMDSRGLPLEAINECLRQNHCGFNVVLFVQAALDSKNFTYGKIKRRLIESMQATTTGRVEFERTLDRAFNQQIRRSQYVPAGFREMPDGRWEDTDDKGRER